MHSLRWACQLCIPDGASQRRLTVCHSSSTARPEATSQRRSCQLCITDGASQCHFCHQSLPDGASQQRSCQLRLPDGALASSSASAPQPASNKPHSAEKSTPVWLAIWHIWAGFANSQLRRTAFRCIYSYMCTHPRYYRHKPLRKHSKSFGPSAPIAYATCVSPPDEAAAWPGAGVRWQMRLPHRGECTEGNRTVGNALLGTHCAENIIRRL